MRDPLPDGTRAHLPSSTTARAALRRKLHDLYASWGYRSVEVPMLERYDAEHPRARQAFAFPDRDGGLLTLRSDFTPAVGRPA
ncbi:MAG: ATP phosphoribosyltransferase regulatory subunit, partial [Trueperaceae bacterium]